MVNSGFTTNPSGKSRSWMENSFIQFKKGQVAASRLVRRVKSETAGRSGKVKKNSYMENLVELEDGRRVYMTNKEMSNFNKSK